MPFVDLHCDTIARLLAYRRAGLPGQLRTGEGAHVTLEKLQRSGYLLQSFALFVNLQGETPVPRTFTACPWAAGRGRRWRRF